MAKLNKKNKKKNKSYGKYRKDLPYGKAFFGKIASALFGGKKRQGNKQIEEAEQASREFEQMGFDAPGLKHLKVSPSDTLADAREKGIGHFYDGIKPPEVDTAAFEKGEQMRKASEASAMQASARLTPEQAQAQIGNIQQKSIEGDVAAEQKMSDLEAENEKMEYDAALNKAGAEAEFDSKMASAIGEQDFAAQQHMSQLGQDYLKGIADSKASGEELKLQQKDDLFGGIGDAIGSFFSDERMKEDVEKVGKSEEGVPIVEFEYKDDDLGEGRYRGVIAQDLIGTEHEDALIQMDNGMLGVDYDKIDVDMEEVPDEEEKPKEENMEEMQMQPGEPEVSPGEESHEKNPIDMVQDGMKIGELTGGEFIMPSKDADKVSEFLKEGDSEALFMLMDKLVTKWKKKADEDDEKMAEVLKEEEGSSPQSEGPRAEEMPQGMPQEMPEELLKLTGAMNMAAAGAYLKKQ